MDSADVSEYEDIRSKLEPLGVLISSLLSALLDSSGIKFHRVDYRVKKRHSIQRKILNNAGRYAEPGDLTDLLGIRITTYFPDEVDAVANLVESEFAIDLENSVDKRQVLEPNRFGYLSMHYIVCLSEQRAKLVEYKRHAGVKFEIQIRSILQHAWAEIEHDLGYKSEVEIPSEVRRRFARLAGLLELADEEFRSIRDDLRLYAERIETEISAQPESVEINRDSLIEFIEQSEAVHRINEAVAEILLRTIVPPTAATAAKEALLLNSFGMTNIAELDKATRENEQVVIKFVRNWVKLRRKYPAFNDTNRHPVSAVVAIFYLRNILMLQNQTDDQIAAFLRAEGQPVDTTAMAADLRKAYTNALISPTTK